jgi:hypothetical protein
MAEMKPFSKVCDYQQEGERISNWFADGVKKQPEAGQLDKPADCRRFCD